MSIDLNFNYDEICEKCRVNCATVKILIEDQGRKEEHFYCEECYPSQSSLESKTSPPRFDNQRCYYCGDQATVAGGFESFIAVLSLISEKNQRQRLLSSIANMRCDRCSKVERDIFKKLSPEIARIKTIPLEFDRVFAAEKFLRAIEEETRQENNRTHTRPRILHGTVDMKAGNWSETQ